jgi:hypothetical protein
MKTDNKSMPSDTLRDSAVKQFNVLQTMGANARAAMTFELSDNLRSILEDGIHQRHPDYCDDDIKMSVLRLTVDKNLFNQAFPDCKVTA